MTLDEAVERRIFKVRKRYYSEKFDYVEINAGADGLVMPEARIHGPSCPAIGVPIFVKGRSLEWDWLEWSDAWLREAMRPPR
jgi:hypothetical protein